MRKILFFFITILSVNLTIAQEEFNAIVTVNSDQVQSTNKQVYKTLQESLTEFINQTKWTNKKFLPQEQINCAFTIIIKSQTGNKFEGSIQVQATRPVYGASYETPIFNINDTDFSFKYNEFQPLNFNPNSFDGNLISTIVFYAYTILGVDADTFALSGGSKYYKQAASIMRLAQQSGGGAWQDEMGKQNRFTLIDGFTSPKFDILHGILYNYHIKGLDILANDELKGKTQIANALLRLKNIHNISVGNYMLRVFLDAKSEEIANIFSSGKRSNKEIKLQEMLNKISPTQSDKWKKIK